ncbi:MAG: hypothetical protein E7557_04095 [Ruminococcaceae bacterium]|nr:hypothetical protein [Oscillospiraceae bacterium]
MKQKRKIIAPILITLFVIIYYIFYFCVLCSVLAESIVLLILFGIIPVALSAGMLYVCIQRIKEIRSGEEDDLSKY